MTRALRRAGVGLFALFMLFGFLTEVPSPVSATSVTAENNGQWKQENS